LGRVFLRNHVAALASYLIRGWLEYILKRAQDLQKTMIGSERALRLARSAGFAAAANCDTAVFASIVITHAENASSGLNAI
jgi:hypothetical protein